MNKASSAAAKKKQRHTKKLKTLCRACILYNCSNDTAPDVFYIDNECDKQQAQHIRCADIQESL